MSNYLTEYQAQMVITTSINLYFYLKAKEEKQDEQDRQESSGSIFR